jgi:hypothetical protein
MRQERGEAKMLTTKQVLLDRVTQERGTVFYAIAFMPEEELVRRPVIGEWSVKDILGHLAAWEEEIMRGIEQFGRGERPALLDFWDDMTVVDHWNAVQAQQGWDQSLADTKAELIATRQRLLDLVSGLPDEVFERVGPAPSHTCFVPDMLNAIADHDRQHWAALMAYKAEWVRGQQVRVQEYQETAMAPAVSESRPPLLTR